MKPGRFYKWGLLGLLGGAYFFHQADRALFAILKIPIQEELGLTQIQLGWIDSALFWTLALMAFVAGPIGDRFSRKWLITLSLIFWSLMTVCMGFVGEWHVWGVTLPAFLVVMFFRSFATGGGESLYGPSATALLASHHTTTRSVALSVHQAALYIGLMTSGILATWTLGWLGTWRRVFMAFGGAGFLLGVSFIWLLKEKPEAPSAVSDRPSSSPLDGIKCFFRTPSAILAMTGFIAIVLANNAYLSWGPMYAAMKFCPEAHAADPKAAVAAVSGGVMFWHHLFAFAAILLGGVLTDRFVRRWARFRLGLQIAALVCGAPFLVGLGLAPSYGALLASAALYGVFRGLFEVNTHASLFDVIPACYRATAVGVFLVFAFFIGGFSGILMGVLSEYYGIRGFEIGFALMGVTYLVAAACLAVSFFRTFRRDRLPES